MGWDNLMYGQNCYNGRGISPAYDNGYDRKISPAFDRRGCDGRDLLKGISKNDFIKVFLKNSRPVEGFFAGVSKNILTLFDCEKRRVSTIDICLDDVVAIKSFGDAFDPRNDHDHDHDHDYKCFD
ncbi:hypothetical protein ABNN70_11100 [Sporolactobacillus sp. Y61]|uniref:Spore coat protein n=1 Tax=Sporolactobacillus sp. Y61 TaxID=3160863 RepID=A0AAU8IDD0_9BACL